MPLHVPKTTLEAALGNGMVRKFRDFALVVLDGEGALCVPNDVWLPAASWANGRSPSGNRIRDRMALLGRLDVLVTRRGTAIVSTSGAPIRLARLRDQMKRDGLDIAEWNFPAAAVLDAALAAPAPAPKAKADPDAAAAEPATDTSKPD